MRFLDGTCKIFLLEHRSTSTYLHLSKLSESFIPAIAQLNSCRYLEYIPAVCAYYCSLPMLQGDDLSY